MARGRSRIGGEHVLLVGGAVIVGLFVYHRYHGGGKKGG
jgi:hypothetical protein